ncbi:MAG: methyltransferase domain-containing protein [Nocardioides sp.]|nr:methyltransferase domain-containing protein [Nocardioides sp.]
MTYDAIEPDTKDWTWVLTAPCPECGYVADDITVDRIPEIIRDNATDWEVYLAAETVRERPRPAVWSALEYGAHVRDVHRRFTERVRLMLDEDDPLFPNWDQDATAREDDYASQDPATVAAELLDAADLAAVTYEKVAPDAWGRAGRRDNGSRFTVESLGRYHLHDIVHHLWDVRSAAKAATVAAYNASATAYAEGRGSSIPEAVRPLVERFVEGVGEEAHVLEIGSGPGLDALALEAAGVRVRRTDISAGFVSHLRRQGYAASQLDPLTDNLLDPVHPELYDGVWASATLLHVARPDLPTVLARLAGVTRPGGMLHVSLKEGDGEDWSRHGNVDAPRLFVYWREEALRTVLEGAGWVVDSVERTRTHSLGEVWLDVFARRR